MNISIHDLSYSFVEVPQLLEEWTFWPFCPILPNDLGQTDGRTDGNYSTPPPPLGLPFTFFFRPSSGFILRNRVLRWWKWKRDLCFHQIRFHFPCFMVGENEKKGLHFHFHQNRGGEKWKWRPPFSPGKKWKWKQKIRRSEISVLVLCFLYPFFLFSQRAHTKIFHFHFHFHKNREVKMKTQEYWSLRTIRNIQCVGNLVFIFTTIKLGLIILFGFTSFTVLL